MLLKGLMIFFFLGASGCNYYKNKGQPHEPTEGATGVLKTTSANSVFQDVIVTRCSTCHSANGGNQGGLNLETWDQAQKSLSRIKVRALEKKDMPPQGPLSTTDLTRLAQWIESGAQESPSTGDDDTLTTQTLTFAVISEKVLGPHCYQCHSPPYPEKDLDLTQLQTLRDHAASILDHVIVKQDMPLPPVEPLSVSSKKALADWIIQGLPE